MIDTQTTRINETIDALAQVVGTAIDHECPDEFGLIENKINQLEAFTRECQQEMWAEQAQTAIEHLETSQALTDADIEVIRTFLVADAEHYLAVENNYGDWLTELQRVFDDLSQRASNLDSRSIGEFRGVLKDAIRLIPDIRNYLEDRRRVEKFNVALHTVDSQSRGMLARVLREQLNSPNR